MASTSMATLSRLIAAWSAVLCVVWLALEATFFCCSAFMFPYAARLNLGFGVYPLLQTSKSSTTPAHYTAIFGDSYAFGEGDWFLQVQQQHNPAFNVTHLLHASTGRDFISFGVPGSSNLSGWIDAPTGSLNYINASWRHPLSLPEHILLYFYEGNDIAENYLDLQSRYIINGYKLDQINNHAYFDRFIREVMLPQNSLNQEAQKRPWTNSFYFLSYARIILENALDNDGSQKMINDAIADLYRHPKTYSRNAAHIAGTTVYLPDGLSAPAIDLSAQEREQSMLFLQNITKYVRQQYPQQRMSIIYIPSAAVSYDVTSEFIDIYENEPDLQYRTTDIASLSNATCTRVQRMAEENHMDFVDVRPSIRAAGQHAVLHGPADTGHFNRAGFEALSAALDDFLQATDSYPYLVRPCQQL